MALFEPSPPARGSAAYRVAALLGCTLLLAACSGRSSDSEQPPAGSSSYTIGGTVSGLTSGAVVLRMQGQEISAGNGPFTFPTPVAGGSTVAVASTHPLDPAHRCEVDRGPFAVVASVQVAVTCVLAHTVGGTVTGLEQDGLFLLLELPDRRISQRVSGNGPFTFTTPALPGQSYSVSVDAENTAPSFTQKCAVTSSAGVIEDTNVTTVAVECGDATASYTVSGLLGSGLIVSLSREVENNGAVQMLVVERMDVAADGGYTFETVLGFGEPYAVGIWQQPTSPEQECWVENGAGVVEADVVDVEVKCPELYRYYRFDDTQTWLRGVPRALQSASDPDPPPTPLKEGEKLGDGVLDDDYLFTHGSAVPLGSVSGLDTEELFELYLDGPGSMGIVHSNTTGKTYWLAAESPNAGVPRSSPAGGPIASHHVHLDTAWAFRKVGAATFRLQLTHIHLLALDNYGLRGICGTLQASADLRIRAFVPGTGDAMDDGEGDAPAAVTFFDAHGGIDLIGYVPEPQGNCSAPIVWELEPRVRDDALAALWTEHDFELDPAAGVNMADPERVAFAKLAQPMTIEIDLSHLPVGAEILVLSEAHVKSHNNLSAEGGTATYLRDPASSDSGEPGGATIETTGLVMIDLGNWAGLPALQGLSTASPPPPVCEASTSPPSVLEFEAVEYAVSEALQDNRTPIRITRTGSTAGVVTALVRMGGGSAIAGEDYVARDLIVRFGDGSAAPRTIDLPILDDGAIEPDETLTLELVEPAGCAEIGPRAAAQITITDDDNAPGGIAFASASLDAAEDAVFATLTLARTGGTVGTIAATIRSDDGSATAGADYTPILTTVVFGDGDAGPLEVLVRIADDRIIEPDETVTFTLSALLGQIGSPSTAVLTIRDDDAGTPNTVQFAAAQFVGVEADGSVAVAVTRYGEVGGAASVRIATRDGTAVAAEDYAAFDQVVSFTAVETTLDVDIVLLSSPIAENDETLTLELSEPFGFALGLPASAELLIAESDSTVWGSWQPDVEIDAAAGAAGDAQVAFDDDGNALAVWVQEAANRTDVWSNYYQAGIGWGTAMLVAQSSANSFADAPRIAFDSTGDAMAVWARTDAPGVWASRFAPASGWSPPEPLEAAANEVIGDVALAVHQSGDAIAVWTRFDGARASIQANRYSGGTWVGAERVDSADELVEAPQVAVAANGDVLVAWQQSPTGVAWNVWTRRYSAGGGWEPAALVSSTNTGAATRPQLTFDGTGSAFVLWLQNPGFDRAVYAARQTGSGGWSVPQIVGPGDGAEQHRLVADAAGNAIAVWRRAESVGGTTVLTAFANRFTPGGGWGVPVAVSTRDAFHPAAAMREDGRALAVWHELDVSQPPSAGYGVWASRYDGGGWGAQEQIGTSGGPIGFGMPNVAVGPNGEALAIWTRGGEVRVNRFE